MQGKINVRKTTYSDLPSHSSRDLPSHSSNRVMREDSSRIRRVCLSNAFIPSHVYSKLCLDAAEDKKVGELSKRKVVTREPL